MVDTGGRFSALMTGRQARANAVADADKRREEAIAATSTRQEEDREELARKMKLHNTAKLKAL